MSRIEQQLAGVGGLEPVVEQAIEELLNLVERLVSGQQALAQEVQRLKEQLEQKKKGKTTGPGDGSQQNTDHSSEKHRRNRDKPKALSASDRRTFKDLKIDETIECPVDPKRLPPDAVRVGDEEVIVPDIEIKPRNIRFLRSAYYWPKQNKYFRGLLPSGYDHGDFGADSVPVIETIVCDDAGQFKLLTARLALCWIHAGRHYEKLSPVVPRHANLLDAFVHRYWDYYQSLQRYRDGPTNELAETLRKEFDELFSTRTGLRSLG